MLRLIMVTGMAICASACSPIEGTWSGTCSANGDWSLQLSSLSSFNGDMPGAEQPSEWDAVRGVATITPTLGDLTTGTATLYYCDELYAPCTFLESGDLTEVDAGYVIGDINAAGKDEASMHFIGEMFGDDGEIEGSCYNLVSGGAGVLNLNR
ncbi:MAG: hypothetical protein ACI8S6_002068 [Myxococcota bacterium]|jgi:hypothetical protein